MNLQLFLDSADPKDWEEWLPTGIFKGITTNPTLLRRANQHCTIENLKDLAIKAESLGCKELHLQAWGESANELEICGKELSTLATQLLKVHVKIPLTKSGNEAALKLISSNISVTFTACYEIHQVLFAAALKASFIAPYLGRINDLGREGIVEIITMQKILNNLDSNCTILVASVRDKNEIIQLLSEGLNTFTIQPLVAKKLIDISETLQATELFQNDSKH